MTYELQPGTLPHRVVTWLKLQPTGASISSAVIAEEIGADLAGFTSSLQAAKKHGFLAMKKELNVCYWSLGDGKPEPEAFDHEKDQPLHAALASPKLNDGAATVFKLRAPKAAKKHKSEPAHVLVRSTQFRVGEFSDGTFVIERSGLDRFELSESEFATLLDFVERRAGGK